MGDYVIDNSVGIERKTANDYINSLVDGRLFDQLSRLKEVYEKALLIVEGNLYRALRSRGIHRNAVLGAIITLSLDLDIHIIYTKDEEETAEVIKRIALHKTRKFMSVQPPRKPKEWDLTRWQLFILQCFPNVGPKIAQRLLEYFGTIHAFCNASVSALSRIEGLSEQKASEIYRIIHAVYKDYTRGTQSEERRKSVLDYVSSRKEKEDSV
uniref:ERCC4 domain-containing protein n=1 Tax=Ignisphaera aggregans TaxID=334771 RepID=A0A7C2ZRD8_9CREN